MPNSAPSLDGLEQDSWQTVCHFLAMKLGTCNVGSVSLAVSLALQQYWSGFSALQCLGGSCCHSLQPFFRTRTSFPICLAFINHTFFSDLFVSSSMSGVMKVVPSTLEAVLACRWLYIILYRLSFKRWVLYVDSIDGGEGRKSTNVRSDLKTPESSFEAGNQKPINPLLKNYLAEKRSKFALRKDKPPKQAWKLSAKSNTLFSDAEVSVDALTIW